MNWRLYTLAMVAIQAALGGARLLADDEAEAEKAAIRKSVDAYVAAFNQGDAKALSELWTDRGEMITAAGERWQGRQQLQSQFAKYFAAGKKAKLELEDTQIEIQSPHVAVETGPPKWSFPTRSRARPSTASFT